MKIAIVGAGIVGSTAAYYLSKEKDVEVTVFDHGLGQATKAAAGIISPWFSKRRNKAWYRTVSYTHLPTGFLISTRVHDLSPILKVSWRPKTARLFSKPDLICSGATPKNSATETAARAL